MPLRSGLTRFDRIVLAILAGLAALTLLVIARGDRVGVRVAAVSPADGAIGVANRTTLRVTFDQEMLPTGSAPALNIEPPVAGAAQWDGATLTFFPLEPLAPDTAYRITVAAGLYSQDGQQTRRPYRWQFRTGRPQVLFMALDAAQRHQISLVDPAGGAARQLTQEGFGVWDYAAAPDGAAVAYAALRADQGSDLWLVQPEDGQARLLLACPDAACSGVAWAPDSQRLIYERRNSLGQAESFGPARLWWLDVASGETVPVFQDEQQIGFGASLSPDGRWLSYVAPGQQGIQLYALLDGRSLLIPNEMGEPAAWSPGSDSVFVSDVRSRGERFAVHLLRVNADSGVITDLSGEESQTEDRSPAPAPDGKQLAFSHKKVGGSPAAQIWLTPGAASGGAGQALTADPRAYHGSPTWSPDGRSLLYQRLELGQSGVQPEIWLMDMATQQAQLLAPAGSWPSWLP